MKKLIFASTLKKFQIQISSKDLDNNIKMNLWKLKRLKIWAMLKIRQQWLRKH